MRWIRTCWNWIRARQRRLAETLLRPDAVTLAYRPAGAPDTRPSMTSEMHG